MSNSTLARSLKRNIGMTYKKVNWVHPSIGLHENKMKMLKSVFLQIKLAQDGVDVVYVDELKYSCYQSNHYGWAKKGKYVYN